MRLGTLRWHWEVTLLVQLKYFDVLRRTARKKPVQQCMSSGFGILQNNCMLTKRGQRKEYEKKKERKTVYLGETLAQRRTFILEKLTAAICLPLARPHLCFYTVLHFAFLASCNMPRVDKNCNASSVLSTG